jgi:hypothetical protein
MRPRGVCRTVLEQWRPIAVFLPVLVGPSPAFGADSFSIDLAAGRRVTESVGSEWSVFLGITIPFDRFYRRVAVAETDSSDDPPDESSTLEPVDTTPRSRRTQRAPSPPLDPRFARETIEVVLRAQGDSIARRRLDSLASRSNTSAWLPELRVAAGRSTDQTLRLAPTTGDPYRYTQSGGSDLWGQVRLSWKLNRLVFASDELSVERIRDQRVEHRMRLVRRVFETLMKWHRARLRALDPSIPPEERQEASLDRLEAELWLDILSEGWFSRRVRDRSGHGEASPL